jgi:hypothetical protein
LGIPRWQKRVHYYFFKLSYNKHNDATFKGVPNARARVYMVNNFFNEYEFYNVVV